MNNKRIQIYSITMVLLLVLSGFFALFLMQGCSAGKMDAFEQNKRLGRGVNIIGYDPIWRSREKARIQDEHFKLIKEAGFNNVRINMHPFRQMDSKEDYTISQTWLEILNWAVEQALSNELMVILDLHEYSAMGRDPIGNKERFLAVWKQLTDHYKDYPNDVIFEILNEPSRKLTPELWNQYLIEVLTIIRETNPARAVIIGPASYNNINYLEELELPEDDLNIIVTVHYYSPMEFTHQGASWSSHKDKVGIEWNATPGEKQAIVQDFEKAQTWAQQHNRPLFLGEFGAYDKGDMPSRVRYTSFVVRQAERLGWSWAYWQFDSDFIVYDIPNKKWVEPIRDALIPPAK